MDQQDPTAGSSRVAISRHYFIAQLMQFFREIGRLASEEVVLQLITSKCIPVILYGSEACPLTKSDLLSMDFVKKSIFMKLFKTRIIYHVKYCQECFSFDMPSDLWRKL